MPINSRSTFSPKNALSIADRYDIDLPKSLVTAQALTAELLAIAGEQAPAAPSISAKDVRGQVAKYAEEMSTHGSIVAAAAALRDSASAEIADAGWTFAQTVANELADRFDTAVAELTAALPDVAVNAAPDAMVGDVKAFASYSRAVELSARMDAIVRDRLLLAQDLSAIESAGVPEHTALTVFSVPDIRSTGIRTTEQIKAAYEALRGAFSGYLSPGKNDSVVRLQSSIATVQRFDVWRTAINTGVPVSLARVGNVRTRAALYGEYQHAMQLSGSNARRDHEELAEMLGFTLDIASNSNR